MTVHTRDFTVRTPGRGLHDVTAGLRAAVAGTVRDGVCNVFLLHTSASLVIQENADPKVLTDLNRWFDDHVPDGHPVYTHRDEGDDDMPAHIRAALTASALTLPVRGGALQLGTWQGVYVFEHRHRAHSRSLSVTVIGE